MLSSQEAETRSPPAVSKKSSSGIGHMFKETLRTMVRAIPGGRKVVEPLLRDMRLKFRRWMWAFKSDGGQYGIENNLLKLDPALIEFYPPAEFAYKSFKGGAMSGDWDLSNKQFDRLELYEAFDQVCKHKTKTWQETSYYKTTIQHIEAGQEFHWCRTREEFDARCDDLSAIYESIAQKGYKSQTELGHDPEHEIAIAIGRNGQILFSDGAHRLAMAKLLGINEIPVLVSVRHPKWAAFKAQLLEFAKTQTLGSLYQQALHPDLLSIPAEHGCSDRFKIIQENLVPQGGKLLDIGANLAYMCHRFEDQGFDCTAIEIDETYLYFMKKLRAAADKKFDIRFCSFLDDMEITQQDFEVVLALNIFHHFLKEEPDYIKLIDFLKRLKANYIVFEPHLTDEPQMANAHKNYAAEEFCAFVMEHTGMNSKARIYQAHDGREVYILSR